MLAAGHKPDFQWLQVDHLEDSPTTSFQDMEDLPNAIRSRLSASSFFCHLNFSVSSCLRLIFPRFVLGLWNAEHMSARKDEQKS